MNSSTGAFTQLNAPAEICIGLRPRLAGEVLKMNQSLVLLFNNVTESAGVPSSVKALASRVAGVHWVAYIEKELSQWCRIVDYGTTGQKAGYRARRGGR